MFLVVSKKHLALEETPLSELIEMEMRDGILHVNFNAQYLDVTAARYVVSERERQSGGIPVCILVEQMGVTKFSKEARDYLGTEEGQRGVIAMAVIVDNPFKASIVNFFIKVCSLKYQLRLFTRRAEALKWLQKQLQLQED